MKFILCFLFFTTLLVESSSHADYVDCDRTLNRITASCGVNTDILSCQRIMNADRLISSSLFTFTECVKPSETVTFAFPGNIRVFHAAQGSLSFGDECPGNNQVMRHSDGGVGTVVWTAPSTPGDVDILLASRPVAMFGQVTLQNHPMRVASDCTLSPTDSPSMFPTATPTTPAPTNAPTTSPTSFPTASPVPSVSPTSTPTESPSTPVPTASPNVAGVNRVSSLGIFTVSVLLGLLM